MRRYATLIWPVCSDLAIGRFGTVKLGNVLRVGRKMPANLLRQLEETGYLDRDEEQGRDEHNRFLPYNYIVRDIPEASTRYSTGSAWVASKV